MVQITLCRGCQKQLNDEGKKKGDWVNCPHCNKTIPAFNFSTNNKQGGENMAKGKAKEVKERKSEYKDYLIKAGYKLTGDNHKDLLAYFRLTNRHPAWTVKEAQQGFKVKVEKVKKEKKAKK